MVVKRSYKNGRIIKTVYDTKGNVIKETSSIDASAPSQNVKTKGVIKKSTGEIVPQTLQSKQDQEWLGATDGNTAKRAIEEKNKVTEKENQFIEQNPLPQTNELNPQEQSNIPVVGGLANQLTNTGVVSGLGQMAFSPANNIINAALPGSPDLFKGKTQEEEEMLTPANYYDPVTGEVDLRRTEIENEVYKKGIKLSEKFGAVIEAFPVIGKLGRKWGVSTTSPGTIIDSLKDEIKKQSSLATDYANNELVKKEDAKKLIADIEEKIDTAESKIKLRLIYSETYRSDPTEIDNLEIEILTAKNQLWDAKKDLEMRA